MKNDPINRQFLGFQPLLVARTGEYGELLCSRKYNGLLQGYLIGIRERLWCSMVIIC